MDDEVVDRIIENVDICEYISNYVDLENKAGELFGVCPFHKEDTASFSVTPSKKLFYCFGCGASGNVINFVQKYNGISFGDAVDRLTDEYGIDRTTKLRSETVAFLKKTAKNRFNLPEVHHQILNPSIMNKYIKANIVPWNEEGIPQKIIDKYGVRIDTSGNRIVYPVYDNDGNLINIKGRTLYQDYKSMKQTKYMNYYKVVELDYFQGYHMKKHIIADKGEIIIFEGIKSCMKLDSFGIYNSVSSETSKLSPYQIKILVGLQLDVVIAYDNDVDYKKIQKNVEMLKRFTNVYIIHDKDGLLGDKSEKNSPVDKGFEVWQYLYENKIRQ